MIRPFAFGFGTELEAQLSIRNIQIKVSNDEKKNNKQRFEILTNLDINPSPAAILTGHENEITCLWISAEMGIVLSGSERGFIIEHTLAGELLRSFENPTDLATPRLLYPSIDGDVVVGYDRSKLCLYTLNGKLTRQAVFEDDTIQVRFLNMKFHLIDFMFF